jgi:hypothetical protein
MAIRRHASLDDLARSRTGAAVCAGFVALVLALSLLAGSATGKPWADAGAQADGQRTYARFENGPPEYRPRHLFFGGHAELVSLRWSKWGTKLAQGSGTYQLYGCPPNNVCGEPAPARAVLIGRRPCGEYFVFKRLKVDFEVSGQPRSRTFRAYCAGA